MSKRGCRTNGAARTGHLVARHLIDETSSWADGRTGQRTRKHCEVALCRGSRSLQTQYAGSANGNVERVILQRAVPYRTQSRANTDDPAKAVEVPLVDGDSPAEGCGVTSDRQRCSCRRALVQVEKQTTWRGRSWTSHAATLRRWVCVQGRLVGTQHALGSLGEGRGRARFRVSPIWAGRDCEIA